MGCKLHSKFYFYILNILITNEKLDKRLPQYISKKSLDSNIKHQRLSVVPALNYYDDFTLRPDSEGVGIKIKNSGLGPALFKEVKISWGEIKINSPDDYEKIPKDNLYGAFEGGFYTKNYVFAKNKEVWIFRIPLNNITLADGAIDIDKVDKIKKELKDNFRLEILYRSLYDLKEFEYLFKYPLS